jgi:hypothetical protein
MADAVRTLSSLIEARRDVRGLLVNKFEPPFVLQPVATPHAVPLLLQGQNWTRATMPKDTIISNVQTTPTSGTEHPLQNDQQVRHGATRRAVVSDFSTANGVPWNPKVIHKTVWRRPTNWTFTSAIGTVAHQQEPPSPVRTFMPEGKPRLFLDTTPGLMQLIPNLELRDQPQDLPRNLLTFRLRPSPLYNEGLTNVHRLPELFIDYAVSPMHDVDRTAKFHKATLVVWQKLADVLLPIRAADIRYTEQITAEISGESYEAGLSRDLDEWIVHTRESIEKGGRIRPRSTVIITLPFWVDKSQVRKSRRKAAPKGNSVYKNVPQLEPLPIEPADKPTFDVTYEFASVEHRETLPFEFEGYPLLYTNREGGKMTGRGTSLSLKFRTDETWTGPNPEAKKERDKFVLASMQLSELVDRAVRGMSLEPEEEGSA